MQNNKKIKGQPSISKWSEIGDDRYIGSYPTIETLPSGYYSLKWFNDVNRPGLQACKNISLDELYELPSVDVIDIINDIRIFWESRSKYKQYNIVHKRGILLYGSPGCGKSGIIQLCCNYLINKCQGIVINLKDADSVDWYIDSASTFRDIEPDRPFIVLLEDIDSITQDNSYITSKLLNILDGINQIDNVVYIATTNYPDKLSERISNRPGRFDRLFNIEPPDAVVRKSYLESKLKIADKNTVDINYIVAETEGLSLAHLRELVAAVFVMGYDLNETIYRLKNLKDLPKLKNKQKLGF